VAYLNCKPARSLLDGDIVVTQENKGATRYHRTYKPTPSTVHAIEVKPDGDISSMFMSDGSFDKEIRWYLTGECSDWNIGDGDQEVTFIGL
jgi:hypothetical protein